jgi:hypothetical protein
MAKQKVAKSANPQNDKLAVVLDRLIDDSVLRRELTQDPVGTLARLGIEVDVEEAELILERVGVSTSSKFAPPYVPIGPVLTGNS